MLAISLLAISQLLLGIAMFYVIRSNRMQRELINIMKSNHEQAVKIALNRPYDIHVPNHAVEIHKLATITQAHASEIIKLQDKVKKLESKC